MGEDNMQLVDTRKYAANRAQKLVHDGKVQNTFKDILDWIKECTLEKANKAVATEILVREYSKQCACERIENDTISRIYNEFIGLMKAHNRNAKNVETDTHNKDEGVEI